MGEAVEPDLESQRAMEDPPPRMVTRTCIAVICVFVSGCGGSGDGEQLIEIKAKGTATATSNGTFVSPGTFVLDPLGKGSLEQDSGKERSIIAKQRAVLRHGQLVDLITWVTTCKGKRGNIVFRARMTHIDAGHANGDQIAAGTWRVLRGTGAYAGMTGGGQVHNEFTASSGVWTERRSGYVTIP